MFWSPIPTTDLYFLNSCQDLVRRFPWQGKPVLRLGDNSFQNGNRFLVIRRDKERVLHRILSKRDAEIFYLIDDDVWSAPKDMSLPTGYRKRLAGLSSGMMADLIERTNSFIVSSDALRIKVPAGGPVEILHPCWHTVPPDRSHFEQNKIKLVHLGTNSHMAGFEFLQPVLEQVLEISPSVTFTYYSKSPLLGKLDGHSRVIRRKNMRWSEYKKRIDSERFHLGLYPMMNTLFNNGRSYNKILEYSLTGCAGMYSSDWHHAAKIDQGVNGWLCENKQQLWIEKILHLINNPNELLRVFRGASQLFFTLNDLQRQRTFWQRIFIKE